MAGHSKWANIKRKKAATDAKRGKIFSKLVRLITVAAKEGGGDVDANPSLRLAVDKAKAANMPKDNIQRAIDKGTGKSGSVNYYEAIYEGYGPEGVAFYIKALTDNKNRTVAEVRNVFTRFGGSLGDAGSAAYIFNDPENPSFDIPISNQTIAEKLMNLYDALEDLDDIQDIYTNMNIDDSVLSERE
jgi:YebC/PmpR family DNA-binding regulatory protein